MSKFFTVRLAHPLDFEGFNNSFSDLPKKKILNISKESHMKYYEHDIKLKFDYSRESLFSEAMLEVVNIIDWYGDTYVDAGFVHSDMSYTGCKVTVAVAFMTGTDV